MKISELSHRSGVPLPTIKFYIREGLLAAGERTSRTQADYNEEHLERLSLIRALKDDAGLSLATITNMLRASDASGENFVEAAIDAIERPVGPPIDESSTEFQAALESMLEVAREMGCAGATGAARDGARALVRVGRAFKIDAAPVVRLYADVARRIAEIEIPDDWSPQQKRMATLRYSVLGTVLFEPVILALRRMAHVARAHSLENRRRTEASGDATTTIHPPLARLPAARRKAARGGGARSSKSSKRSRGR